MFYWIGWCMYIEIGPTIKSNDKTSPIKFDEICDMYIKRERNTLYLGILGKTIYHRWGIEQFNKFKHCQHTMIKP